MKKKEETNNKVTEQKNEIKKCGIIMPIATHTDYPTEHWKDVLNILTEAISETEFEARLVSDDVAIGLIHDRIVTNIYNDDIVVCDVSSKNPNVMFELGMRLAFDKPTIIIKDEKTGYSFDTGVIEHISYPSSLRFSQIVDFKKDLIKKINATYKKSQSEKDYSPFLKSFGKTIVPTSLEKTEIPESKFIMEQLIMIRQEMRNLRSDSSSNQLRNSNNSNLRNTSFIKKKFLDKYLSQLNNNEINIDNIEIFRNMRDEALKLGLGNISLGEIQELVANYQKDINLNYIA